MAPQECAGRLRVLREKTSPKRARLRKRLQRVEELPAADQRAVLKFVDALVESRGIDNGS